MKCKQLEKQLEGSSCNLNNNCKYPKCMENDKITCQYVDELCKDFTPIFRKHFDEQVAPNYVEGNTDMIWSIFWSMMDTDIQHALILAIEEYKNKDEDYHM